MLVAVTMGIPETRPSVDPVSASRSVARAHEAFILSSTCDDLHPDEHVASQMHEADYHSRVLQGLA